MQGGKYISLVVDVVYANDNDIIIIILSSQCHRLGSPEADAETKRWLGRMNYLGRGGNKIVQREK